MDLYLLELIIKISSLKNSFMQLHVFQVLFKPVLHMCMPSGSDLFIEMWSFDTVHTDPRKNVDSCWSEYYVDPHSYMGVERQSLNYVFFGLCFSFRSCTQTSTVVGSLLQTGKTTSQRLKRRSSTSRKPKFSASGTKPNQTQQISPWEVTVYSSYLLHYYCT